MELFDVLLRLTDITELIVYLKHTVWLSLSLVFICHKDLRIQKKTERVLGTLASIPKARSLGRAALTDFCIIDISSIPYLSYIVTCLYILIYILMYSC